MKDGDGVDGKCKDVGDGLGVDELQWLVVGCLDGGENPVPLDGTILKASMPVSSFSSPVSLKKR